MPLDRFGLWTPPDNVHPLELHLPLPPGYTYRSPIPTASTQTPRELIEKLYAEKRNDPDWTDPNGVLSKQLEVFRNYPQNARGTIGASGLIGKWPRPNGLLAEPVPTYGAGLALDGPQVVVEFRNQDRECPSRGVSLTDLYERNPDPLEGAGDIVFHGFGGRTLKFIIAWPGYQPEMSTLQTVADYGAPLTRFDLGQQITMAYAFLFRKVEKERLLPREVGFYNIALHQGLNAKRDSLGVQLMQLYLVRLRGTIGGNWVADIEIV